MTSFLLSHEAAQDIIEIYEFISRENRDAAERVRLELLEALRGLARMPNKGHRRDNLTNHHVLFWPVRKYQVIYRPGTHPLEVVAVLHGKRNLAAILKER